MSASDVDFNLPSMQRRPIQLQASSPDASNPIQARFSTPKITSFDEGSAAKVWLDLGLNSADEAIQRDFVSKFLDGNNNSLETWLQTNGYGNTDINLKKRLSASAQKSPLAQMRKVQLLLQGANVNNSTPASGRVIGPQEPPRKRKYKPSTDEERLDQSIRQLTTPLLEMQEKNGTKGVESQMAFEHARQIGFIGFNNPTANQELFTNLTSEDSFMQSFASMTQSIAPLKSKKPKKAKRRYTKKEQGDTVRRRTSKFRQRARMSSEKRKEEFGEKTDSFFTFLGGLDREKIHQYNPGDDPSTYEDGHLYVLDQNLKVPNTDTDEHVEVNHMVALKGMGSTKDDVCIAGPKCPCATCTTKGREKDLLTYEDKPGKIFDGQIPQTSGGMYSPEFLARMKQHTEGGHMASANYQYAQSDSDYSSDEESETES